MLNITLLGSTGSIGQNTLDVIARNADRYTVFALSANHNIEILFRQCQQFKPKYAVMVTPDLGEQLSARLKAIHSSTEVLIGQQALVDIASHADMDCVLAAIVGAAGLLPTLAAAKAGKRILLANKEALIMSGSLLMEAVQDNNAILLPVDSEHNAIFQCMPTDYHAGNKTKGIRRLILTASGGPFRNFTVDQLSNVTPAQACAHPNWVMGKKISIDSATMMNKALEVIEAHWLFNTAAENISVLLHPQSVVHSMVEYDDGSVLAQLGNPDMRTPIAHALAWPERIPSGVNSLDLITIGRLDFEPLDQERYPALQLAYQALKLGGTSSAILNAANEIGVAAFLAGKISFTSIYEINKIILQELPGFKETVTLDAVFIADAAARELANRLVIDSKIIS